MKNINIALYMRVSTKKQADSRLGLEAQERNILSWIKSRYPGQEKTNIVYFVDYGITGSTLNRKQLQLMLHQIEKNQFDICVIYKVDRLARDIEVSSYIRKKLAKSKCELYSTTENFDLTTVEGNFVYNIQSVFGEHERALIAKRTEDSQISKLKRGEYPFQVSRGYTRISSENVVINPEEERVVKKVFELFLKRYSIEEIRREIKTIYDIKLSHLSVDEILNRYLYTGNYIKKGVKYFNVVPQIISEEIFEKVQKLKNERQKVRREVMYLFGDCVYCARCKIKSYRTSSKKPNKRYYYYRCSCCGEYISVGDIECGVIPKLLAFSFNKKQTIISRQYREKYNYLKKRKLELMDDYIDKRISGKDYTDFVAAIEKRMYELSVKITVEELSINYQKMNIDQKCMFILKWISKIAVDYAYKCVSNVSFITEE